MIAIIAQWLLRLLHSYSPAHGMMNSSRNLELCKNEQIKRSRRGWKEWYRTIPLCTRASLDIPIVINRNEYKVKSRFENRKEIRLVYTVKQERERESRWWTTFRTNVTIDHRVRETSPQSAYEETKKNKWK